MEPDYNPNLEPEIPNGGHGAEIAAVIFACFACAVVAYVFGFSHNIESKVATLAPTQNATTTPQIDPFATMNLQAKAAYVWDVRAQKVIYAQNANTPLPLASITKMMTAYVATNLLAQNATISIDKKSLGQDGDSGLLLNEQWTFKKLLQYTLAVSSNDGAAAVAAAASPDFVDKMNQKAASLGLSTMHFYNETGLDLSTTTSGANASAADTAKLFTDILQTNPDIFIATRQAKFTVSSLDNIQHVAINTDSDIDKIPGLIGSKTGYTDLAGGNLAIVYDAAINYPVVAIILGSTYDGRFTDMANLVNATNQSLSLQKVGQKTIMNRIHHDC